MLLGLASSKVNGEATLRILFDFVMINNTPSTCSQKSSNLFNFFLILAMDSTILLNFTIFPIFCVIFCDDFYGATAKANCILWDRCRWDRVREDVTCDALAVELKPYEAGEIG